jgi:hypothetical protein
VTVAAIAAVKVLGVRAVALPHGPGQVGLGCFHQQVKLVAHQRERVHAQAMGINDRREPLDKAHAVAVVPVDGPSLVEGRAERRWTHSNLLEGWAQPAETFGSGLRLFRCLRNL